MLTRTKSWLTGACVLILKEKSRYEYEGYETEFLITPKDILKKDKE